MTNLNAASGPPKPYYSVLNQDIPDKAPGPNERVVYIDGGFDLFHVGHVEILKNARQLGDFLLIVSVLEKGARYPRGDNIGVMFPSGSQLCWKERLTGSGQHHLKR
nr:ethanolamine-phosphate cytidylyltransferase [Tanacetum cinerariifolium]